MPASIFKFASYRLDVDNRQLWRDREAIALRPKTFAVLHHLVENAGRLVTREELVRVVWPNTFGAEKGPKRCILELRAALGDMAAAPQIIATVGRVGYRFLLQPVEIAATTAQGRVRRGKHRDHPLVGRQPELERLRACLDEAGGGERQVIFIAGEPGIGKTSLVEVFLSQVDSDWSVARGQCIEQYGAGEAYLPVVEALGGLARNSESALSLALVRRHAPSWLAQFPALTDGAEPPPEPRVRGASAQRRLREAADLIAAVAAQTPLILVFEDLHWSDHSTLNFLSTVARRQEAARLLLIATYRAGDVDGQSPLRPLTQELLAHGQAQEVALEGLAPPEVAEYVDARFAEHSLTPRFADVLHRLTEGNPLFVVNLVEDLIGQRALAPVEGVWTLRLEENDIAAQVPNNSRRLIERQMARLGGEEQRVLEAAAVAGVQFSAAAIAPALDADVEQVEELCNELARRESFLSRGGIEEWPDGTRSARYRFRHALYQQLWFERVSARRQQRFHLRVGERLETAYTHRAAEIAAELAVHFDQGRDFCRALTYHRLAAQNAGQRSAHQEAADHLNQALAALSYLSGNHERDHQELALQIALSVPLTATRGYAAPEVARTYTRALELCKQAAGTPLTVQASLGLWVFYYARADLETAQSLANRCLEQARRLDAEELMLDAHNAVGASALWRGEFAFAREHLEHSVALHDPNRHPSYVSYDVSDPGVACLSHLGWTLWCLGYPDQALHRGREAIALAEKLAHPYSIAYANDFAAALHGFRREKEQARDRAETAIVLSRDHGFPFWLAMGAILRGWASTGPDLQAAAADEMRQGLAAFQAIGMEIGRPAFFALLAEALLECGQVQEASQTLEEAAAVVRRSGERLYEAEIHRLQGELALRSQNASGCASTTAARHAEECFLRAIDVAREQQGRSWQLRAAVSLARLWRRQRGARQAHALLSEVDAWFTEGADTPDRRAARALLNQLSADA